MDKRLFIDLADNLISREDEIAAIRAEIKEGLEAFASNQDIDKKALKRIYRQYKEYLKNQAEFIAMDGVVAQVINDIIYTETGE